LVIRDKYYNIGRQGDGIVISPKRERMEKKDLLYEGKAKKIYETTDHDLLWIEYKDDATAFDGLKKERLESKGILNNRISSIMFEMLESKGIKTHFLRLLGEREMLVKRLEIIPIEIVVRNIAAGSISKRLGIGEGQKLPRTVIEFYLKDDELHDPMVNHYHIYALGLAQPREMEEIEKQALLVNDALISYFNERGITVVDFKLEFGRHDDGILLGDEISPDTCRLWDSLTGKKMDKDRFRRDLGGVIEAYKEILERIEG